MGDDFVIVWTDTGAYSWCLNFLLISSQETQHMVKRQERGSEEEQCINPGVFQEYIAEARLAVLARTRTIV